MLHQLSFFHLLCPETIFESVVAVVAKCIFREGCLIFIMFSVIVFLCPCLFMVSFVIKFSQKLVPLCLSCSFLSPIVLNASLKPLVLQCCLQCRIVRSICFFSSTTLHSLEKNGSIHVALFQA